MAIQKITASVLGNNAVTAANVAAGALSAADIADNSITAAKLSTSTFAIDSLTVNTSDLVVDTANNRVGIGTSSPATLLDVSGTTPTITISDSQNKSWTSSDTIYGKVSFKTLDGSGIGAHETAYVGVHADVASSTTPAGRLVFGTSNSNTAAAETMTLDGNGFLGLGTSNPNQLLHLDNSTNTTDEAIIRIISGNAGLSGIYLGDPDYGSISRIRHDHSDNTLQFWGSNVAGTSSLQRMTIAPGGDIGIGDSNPNVKLVVSEASGDTALAINDDRSNVADYARIDFRHNNITGSQIKSQAIEDFSVDANRTSDLSFHTRNNGTIIDAMHIQEDGKVGIGTSSPGTLLTVGDGTGTEYITIDKSTTGESGILFKNAGNNKGKILLDSSENLQFYVNNTTNAMTILESGNVGIGETSPDSTLHVKGTGQLNLLKIERAASTPGITFVNGADTAGTFGFQLMDNDEYWAGVYDGTSYNYWFKGNSSVFRVEKPVASSTDSGTRQYSHLCTGSFYSGTGAIVINTNIPAHNASGNANMFSIKIRGFQYSNGGQIDMNVGCYAGEGNYYSATYGGAHVPSQWVDEVHFAENTSTDTVAIILGTTSSGTNYEIAVTDFIQGFINVNENYAEGWTMTSTTDLSGYGTITDCDPKRTVPVEGFHAYLSSSTNLGSGVINLSSTGLTASYNRGNRFNASNGRFTASQDGVYHFDMQVQLNSSTTALSYLSAEVRVNGGTRYIGGWFGNLATGTSYKAASGSVTIPLDAGDYVEFLSEISASHNYLGGNAGYTYISGIKIA